MPVPEERGFFGSLNTIKVLTESTCEDKWDILVQTALPAAGSALYMLIIPDPEEILENYLQPRGRRNTPKRASQGFGRRQATRYAKLRWWQKIGFPDVDNIIAQHLPGRDFFQGRNAGAPELWIWRGIDIVDRGLWYWMLLDLSKLFVVEWASGIMESRFCTSRFTGLFTASGTNLISGTGDRVWDRPGQVVVSINHGWIVQDDGRIRLDNPNLPAAGQVILNVDVTGEDRDPPFTTEHHIVCVKNSGGSGREVLLGPNTPLTSGQKSELAFNATLDGVRSLTFSIATPSGKPGMPYQQSSWGLSVFMDLDA